MSVDDHSQAEGEHRYRPLVSAADVDEANYPRARFDDGIALTIRETARQRAPTRRSVWRHRVGFAGELTAAAYFGVDVNLQIFDDYDGDDGYDLIHNGAKVEVKTVIREDDWELKVPVEKVDTADAYVLAKCSNPSELAQLIGWTPRKQLLTFGHRFDERIRVGPEYLLPFEPIFLPPDQIRASQTH